MEADIKVRRATFEDAEFLAPRLRRADDAEVRAAGLEPLDALCGGLRTSTWAYSIVVGGEVAAIIGVAPAGSLLGSTGTPWFLASDLATRHWRRLIRSAPWWIDRMHDTYPHLVNIVHARNALAIRFLERESFKVHRPGFKLGLGEVFYVFERIKEISDV